MAFRVFETGLLTGSSAQHGGICLGMQSELVGV